MEKLLVLLIQFQDVRATTPASQISNLLFKANSSPESLTDYYRANSYGNTIVSGTVFQDPGSSNGWLTSQYNMAQYGADSATGIDDLNGPIYRLVTEAVQLAGSKGLQFAPFDTDNDGIVDHIMVVHAGQGQENNAANTNLIWSHRWAVLDADMTRPGDQPLMTPDGKRVYNYFMGAESSPLGVFAHEFGHDFGLPDLYDTTGATQGIGAWDIMSGGSWLGTPRGSLPADFSAWSKVKLGFVTPTVADLPLLGATIPQVETNAVIFKLPVPASTGGNEYFLVENREQTRSDAAVPGSGLLIWHVDDAMQDNTNAQHRLVSLMEADFALYGDSPDRSTNPWSNNAVGFTPTSVPNSNSYAGVPTNWMVRKISPSGPTMTADISKQVGLDLSVTQIRRNRFVGVGQVETIGATVANHGALAANNFKVNLSLRRDSVLGTEVYRSSTSVATLAPLGASMNFTWNYTPTATGRYVINVTAFLPGDEVPQDNQLLVHFTAITWIFRDQVEGGTNGWTSPTNPLSEYQWRIVNATDPTGAAYSPTHAWRFGHFATLPSPVIYNYYLLYSPAINVQGRSAYLAYFQRYVLSGVVPGAPGTPLQPINTDVAGAEVSVDGGPWTRVAEFRGVQTKWGLMYADLRPYVGSAGRSLTLRFNVTARLMPPDGGWWIDDIMVLDMPLPAGVYVRPVEATASAPAGGKAPLHFQLVNLGDVTDGFNMTMGLPSGYSGLVGYNESGLMAPAGFKALVDADVTTVLLLAVQIPYTAQVGTMVQGLLTATAGDRTTNSSFQFQVQVIPGFNFDLTQKAILIVAMVVVGLVVLSLVVAEIKKRRSARAARPALVRPPLPPPPPPII
jgi:immune inhibitor A